MHILFIGYGKTSARIAKQLFEQGHQISTISLSAKTDLFATHQIQDVHQLELSQHQPIDWVYILLSPKDSSVKGYQETYLDSVQPIVSALKFHPIKRMIVVSSTRVYGQNAGEIVNDESLIQPNDAQGEILYQMEKAYLKAFPERCTIIRPSGIYGTSVARMQNMARNLASYPNLHWSNRIHIDDLSFFLSRMIHVEYFENSYILTNNQPQLLQETIQWFQKQMNLPLLSVERDEVTGKRLYATRMQKMGFELKHQDCLKDYLELMS
ncbi:NAD(P)-dependent oxidoreductase [Acinetobacter sp. NCu2D-2]|uniref:NAD-dependent epimerase/dehydratase family protein n=1 Tax=Acinetobacter sp. NCu2D-2 TaxID=1608473 RepID=UPI0007CDDC24|nr:NAD-dependent epimerase/dehydratase family protein [Acinetobacter sp. NCu2D-2]ANF82597.1 NAD(P)-dependent oxidoreductase [Acinetobacter sp. NCu2D-2]